MERSLNFLGFLNNIHFAEPVKLQLLAVALALFIFSVIAWLLWLYRRPKMTYGSRYPFFGSYKFWILSTLALALLILAWARPFITDGNIVVKRGNAEVIFIIDSSGSMLLKDTGWARVDIATREIMKLPSLEILKKGDRAALFILGMTGLRRSPMTGDLSHFMGQVSKIGRPKTLLGSNIYWGSDVGATLELVYSLIDRQDAFAEFHGEAPKGWVPKVKQNRLVVFVGDGDYFNYDNEEDAKFEQADRKKLESSLYEFRKRGLKIYPVGIGTRVGAKVIDVLKDYKKEEYNPKLEEDLKGQVSRLDPSSLEYMRSATGAEKLFLIENSDTDASDFLKSVIDRHRSISIEPGIDREPVWLYVQFTLAALAVLMIGIGITRFF